MEMIATLEAFPFDSMVTEDEDGVEIYDRAVSSDNFAEMINVLFSDGVMVSDEEPDGFSVVVDYDEITVHSGKCVIGGRMAILKDDVTFPIPRKTGSYYYLDILITLSTNINDRNITVNALVGEDGGNMPSHTDTLTTKSLDVATVKITIDGEAEVIDRRFNDRYCGIAHANPYSVKAYQDILDKAISDTVAGYLYEQIEDIKNKINSNYLISEYEHNLTNSIVCPANSVTEHKVYFDSDFTKVPDVQATFNTDGSTKTYGSVSFSIANRSKTGVTFRIYNNTDSQRTPKIEYTAMIVKYIPGFVYVPGELPPLKKE